MYYVLTDKDEATVFQPGLLEEHMPDCLFCNDSDEHDYECQCGAPVADGQFALASCDCCDLPFAECLNRLAPESDVLDGFSEFRIPRCELRLDLSAA